MICIENMGKIAMWCGIVRKPIKARSILFHAAFRTEPLSDKELKESGIEVGALAHQGGRAKHDDLEGGEVSLATRYSEKSYWS